MNDPGQRTITIPLLTRVEGEGGLDLAIDNGRITHLQLKIFEPPRLFEKFLEGRDYRELPDLVARICGICPVAYQMSAVHALEQLFQCDPGPWVRAMRRVFYCGEWLESHALHIHLLALPDFLGYSDAAALAKDHAEVVKRGLRLQALGNDLIKLFGARSVHPVGAMVGGFSRAPTVGEVQPLLARLQQAQTDAHDLLHWLAQLPLPQQTQTFDYVALRHDDEYPMNEGRIVSQSGLDIGNEEFEQHFQEFQQPYSTALHCHLHEQPYLVGPLARVNLNSDRLPAPIKQSLHTLGIAWPSHNSYHSIIARAVEIWLAILEALRLLTDYQPDRPHAPVTPRGGIAYGCTEAPRGILWHRYQIDDQGIIRQARIVPPTSQNQARMEQELRHELTAQGLERDDDSLRSQAEQIIRNYDPCISCATHFLDLRVRRS